MPNVVMVVLDDVGFGHLGCYGSSIRTPNLDRLAKGGAQYTNFHVTPMCSPTRAALLTGRNHHAVGMGAITESAVGFPGYLGEVSDSAAMLPELLKEVGYGTIAVGKWHLAPNQDLTPGGPFNHWPLGKGFDRFYGFLGAGTDQYAPELVHDNHVIDPPKRANYHLTEDLVDRSLGMVQDHLAGRPDDPFFLYLSLGACHSPHQAPREYIDRYGGAFDHGWDVERRRVFDRQKATGVVPSSAEYPPPESGCPSLG